MHAGSESASPPCCQTWVGIQGARCLVCRSGVGFYRAPVIMECENYRRHTRATKTTENMKYTVRFQEEEIKGGKDNAELHRL